ncbi:MAG: hypothetical protein ACFFCD_17890 [Promethearchaeota archaeon]
MEHFGKPLCFHHQKEVLPEKFYCSICKEKISEKVTDYSIRHFGKALCMNHQREANPRNTKSYENKTQHKTTYYCSQCRKSITYKVYEYSTRHFNEALCYGCQPVIEKTHGVPPRKPELQKSVGVEIGGKVPKKKPIHNGY